MSQCTCVLRRSRFQIDEVTVIHNKLTVHVSTPTKRTSLIKEREEVVRHTVNLNILCINMWLFPTYTMFLYLPIGLEWSGYLWPYCSWQGIGKKQWEFNRKWAIVHLTCSKCTHGLRMSNSKINSYSLASCLTVVAQESEQLHSPPFVSLFHWGMWLEPSHLLGKSLGKCLHKCTQKRQSVTCVIYHTL